MADGSAIFFLLIRIPRLVLDIRGQKGMAAPLARCIHADTRTFVSESELSVDKPESGYGTADL